MKPSIHKSLFRSLRIWKLYFIISFKYFAAYKLSSILTILFSLIFLVGEILSVDVYYNFEDVINTWDKNSFYILLGTFNLMVCLYTFLFEIAHDEFVLKIKYGDLDFDLVKPMDSQMLSSIQRVDYPSLFNLPIPIWLVYLGVQGLSLNVTIIVFTMYIAMILVGVFLIYLTHQCAVACAFWFTDSSNITTLSSQMVQLGSRPMQVYPKAIQFGFSYVIPFLLCTNLSVDILKQEFQMKNLMILLFGTCIFFFLVRVQWNLGLKRYASASS
ncbi:ABC transporter permease [Parachlamydia acanthamoebae]|uniref:ABC transporter permease n=1 Tax=Parachlamydia acanthamoebae TaxID=83552 RepID=UPI0007517AEE|nr:ABC-2 family transporter protein [Parachlamydia acanthamoebae]